MKNCAFSIIFVAIAGTALTQDSKPAQEDQVKDLQKRVAELEKKSGQSDSSQFRVYWKDGLNMETADKAFRFNLGGRLHIDTGYASYDSDFQNQFAKDHRFEDGIFFRRARIAVGGTMYENIFWKVEFDFAGAAVTFTDVFLGVKDIPIAEEFNPDLTIGHMKEPFSLEELTSSRFITFIERSLPHGAFVPARNTGIALQDAVLDQRMTWAMGVFKDVGASGNSQGTAQDGRSTFALRLTGLPWYENQGREVIHLGAAVRVNNPAAAVQFNARPESRIVTNTTGSLPVVPFAVKDVDQVVQYGFELAVVWESFWVQAEYLITQLDHESFDDPDFSGYYVSAGGFVTGESRNYKKANGVFDRQKVSRPLFDGKGGCGAVEVAVRFSWLDLSDEGMNADEHTGVALAINWYLNPNTRVMLNYVAYSVNRLGGTAEAGVIAIRFSVDW